MVTCRLILAGLVLWLSLAAGAGRAPGVAAAAPPGAGDEYAQQLLWALLAARREAGLADPALDGALGELAAWRSADMAARGYFGHASPEGTTVFDLLARSGGPWWYAGETIARNDYEPGRTAAVAAGALLGSPPHRAIILDARYTHLALGHAVDAHGMHYYAVVWVAR